MDKSQEFLNALEVLFREYNGSICWTCDSGSDMYGVTGEKMQICVNDRPVAEFHYQSYIYAYDIKNG